MLGKVHLHGLIRCGIHHQFDIGNLRLRCELRKTHDGYKSYQTENATKHTHTPKIVFIDPEGESFLNSCKIPKNRGVNCDFCQKMEKIM